MNPLSKNTIGESMPILWPDTINSFLVDGTSEAVNSAKLPIGTYRIAVRSSTDNLGVMIKITKTGTSATTITGMWMSQSLVEYFSIDEGEIISVISGCINVTKVM